MTTFVYTQLGVTLDVQGWWSSTSAMICDLWGSLSMRWEEHQQHQESLQRLLQQQKMTATHKPNNCTYVDGYGNFHKPTNTTGIVSRFLPNRLPELNIFNRFKNSQSQQTVQPTQPTQNNVADLRFRKMNVGHNQFNSQSDFRQKLGNQHVQQQVSNQVRPQTDFQVPAVQRPEPPSTPAWSRDNLMRRPLRSASRVSPVKNLKPYGGASLKKKFMNAFGFTPNSNLPMGIKNDGQNLCFMNSVLQCVARTPNFVDDLIKEAAVNSDCSVADSHFLEICIDILKKCKSSQGMSGSVIDSTEFRKVAADRNSNIVTSPSQPQTQQDAAEFFMWLSETLHRLRNRNKTGKNSLCSSQKHCIF